MVTIDEKSARVPECCICHKKLAAGKSIAQDFGSAGWSIITNAGKGRGLDSPLYTALLCSKCGSIYCYPCAGFRPSNDPKGANYPESCQKCGGKFIPLDGEGYREWCAKQI